MPFATLCEVIAHEQTPLWSRVPESNIYARLQEVAGRHPALLALRSVATTDPAERPQDVTFAQFFRKLTQAANLFTSLGVGATDSVSLLVSQTPAAYYALFGAMTAGIANPLNPLLEPAHLTSLMRAARTAVLVVGGPLATADGASRVEALRAALPGLKAVLYIGNSGGAGDLPAGSCDFEAALAMQPHDRLVKPRVIARDDLAALFHTGGTTGKPRLACQSHGGLLAAAYSNGVAISSEPGLLFMGGTPLFHIVGAIIVGLARLGSAQGIAVLTPAGLRNPEVIRSYWHLVGRLQPDFIGGVPTSLGALLDVSVGAQDLSRVRGCLTGAAALPHEVARRFEQQFTVPVLQGYGMTEVHGYATLNPPTGENRIGSVGLRMPYLELRIGQVGPDGNLAGFCPPGEVGRVLMRGPQVFAGYLDPADNQGAFLADGWLDSGDLGWLDSEGYLWLTGRHKDVIIRGGHNIDPQLIEQVLYQHPAIELAAAVPAPDRYAGELPVAFVKLRPGKAATTEELRSFCRQHISERAAVPVELSIEPHLPLTAMGKIYKPALRLEAARRVFTREAATLAEQGIQLQIEMVTEPSYGMVARLHVLAAGGQSESEIAARCQKLLGSYAIRHEVLAK